MFVKWKSIRKRAARVLMAFQNVADNLVIPTGAVSGQTRIVIGPDLPAPLDTYLFYGSHPAVAAIIYYSTAVDTYQFTAIVPIGSGHYLIQGYVYNGVVDEIANNVNYPAGITYEANSHTNSNIDLNGNVINLRTAGGFTVGDANTDTLLLAASQTGVFAAGHGVFAEDPNNLGFKEVWHPVTFQNGWANFNVAGGQFGTVQYRRVASPAESVQLTGVAKPGTLTSGTVIFNLPLGNRPPASRRIPVYANKPTASGESPAVDVLTNGDVVVLGSLAGAGAVSFDGVVFPTTGI